MPLSERTRDNLQGQTISSHLYIPEEPDAKPKSKSKKAKQVKVPLRPFQAPPAMYDMTKDQMYEREWIPLDQLNKKRTTDPEFMR